MTPDATYQYYGRIDGPALEQWTEAMRRSMFVDVPTRPQYHALMEQHRIKQYFLLQSPLTDAEAEALLRRYKGTLYIAHFARPGPPVLQAYRDDVVFSFADLDDAAALEAFISANRLPVFPKVTQKNFGLIVSNTQRLVVLLVGDYADPAQKELGVAIKKDIFGHIASDALYRQFTLGYMNYTTYRHFLAQFGAAPPYLLVINSSTTPFSFAVVGNITADVREQLQRVQDLPDGAFVLVESGARVRTAAQKVDIALRVAKATAATVCLMVAAAWCRGRLTRRAAAQGGDVELNAQEMAESLRVEREDEMIASGPAGE